MPASLRVSDKASPGFLIRRLQQISVSIFIAALRDFGITPMQYTVLRIVRERPGIDQITVAKLAALDTSTTTDVVGRLAQKGLLSRKPGVADRRTRTLELTPAGKRLLVDCRSKVQQSRRALLAPLAPKERELFLQGLRKMIEGHDAASDSADGAKPWRRQR